MRLLSVTLAAFAFVVLLGAMLLRVLPGAKMPSALTILLWMPIIWVAAMFYCYWDEKRWRPLAIFSLSACACALVVAATEG